MSGLLTTGILQQVKNQASVGYLLDTYTGAAIAYSLRQLKTGITSVVRVRRSSDNAEADFTATEITDGTLTTWTGANNGFVVTWYDQSGNANNATQGTVSYQRQIVNAGSLVLENTKACINVPYQNGNRGYEFGTVIGAAKSLFYVAKGQTGGDSIKVLGGGDSGSFGIDLRTTSGQFITAASTNSSDFCFGGSIYINGTSISSNTSSLGQKIISAFSDSSGDNFARILAPKSNLSSRVWVGTFQEVVIYTTNEVSNVSGIVDNQNSYYAIY